MAKKKGFVVGVGAAGVVIDSNGYVIREECFEVLCALADSTRV